MGLIIGPPIMAWLIAAAYSVYITYAFFLAIDSLFTNALLLVLLLAFSVLYSHFAWLHFKDTKHLSPFESAFYFALNKVAVFTFSLAFLVNIFATELAGGTVASGALIMMVIVSFGTLLCIFRADSFMKKYNITKTY